MERGSRTRLVTAVILASVFGSGVLLGLAVDSSVVASTAEAEADSAEAPAEQLRRGPIYAQVGPTESQQELIDSVIRSWRQKRRDLYAEYRPSFEAYDVRRDSLGEGLRQGIMEVFTPEQAAEYRRLLDKYARRREERDK